MTKIYIPDDIEDWCVACVPVGSRVTCDPPPTNTDQDILCLLENVEAELAFEDWLIKKGGWEFEGEKYGTLGSEFASWRKTILEPVETEYNLILTSKTEWFDKFLKATVECKKVNAMTKKERIAIFDEIMETKKKTVSSKDYLFQSWLFQSLNQGISQQHLQQVQVLAANYQTQAQSLQAMQNQNQQLSLQGMLAGDMVIIDDIQPVDNVWQF